MSSFLPTGVSKMPVPSFYEHVEIGGHEDIYIYIYMGELDWSPPPEPLPLLCDYQPSQLPLPNPSPHPPPYPSNPCLELPLKPQGPTPRPPGQLRWVPPPTPQGILEKTQFFFLFCTSETSKIQHKLRNLLRPWGPCPHHLPPRNRSPRDLATPVVEQPIQLANPC